MSGVELDLACAESDADDFSSSAKSKHVRHVSIEEDQRFARANGADDGDDDDDDIAIIEPTTTNTSSGTRQAQITIENDLASAMDTTFSESAKNDSHENGKRRRSSRAPSSSSSTGASRSSSSSSSSSNSRASNRRSTHDSNDDVLDTDSSCILIKSSRTTARQTKSFTDVEQRKASGMPTLMITVKNEMAQPVDEQTIPSTVVDPAETATLRHIFSDAVYYLIKSGNEENIALAKSKGVWSTPPVNESKLNRAFREHRNVILIFSVAESKAFQGFARMSGEARHDSQPVNWILPPGMSNRAFSGVIHIDWVTRRSLPFNKTSHLFNSWNENKPVKIGRDGQEVEPRCAEALCRLFPSDSAVDIMSIAMKAKRNKKRFSSRSQSRSPLAVDLPRASSPANSLPPPSPPPLPPPPPSSTLIVKRQISKDRSRRSPPADKHRPSSSSNITSRHSSTRPHHHYHQHRSPSANDRHRRQKSRSREREDKDVQRKRRRRSGSSRSDHGGKIAPNRKHSHRSSGDQPSYSTNNKTMAKIISNGTYEEYMNHLFASHVQYAGFGGGMFPPGGYSMSYDANGLYPMGYDHRGLPLPISGGGGYNASTDMYFPSSTSSSSSRSRNPADYDHEINTFLRHTTASGMYMPGDMGFKSHRGQRYHRTETDYRHKTTSRHRSKSREHRR